MDLVANYQGGGPTKHIDLSACIVNHNTKDFALRLVGSLLENTHRIRMEVLVVDNDSSDGTPQAIKTEYPQVKVIANDQNLGFAAAGNRAIRASGGRYVALLGADAVVLPGAMDILVDFMDRNPEVGAVGPKILRPDGTVEMSGKGVPTPVVALLVLTGLRRLFAKSQALLDYYLPLEEYDRVREADQLTGACLLTRRDTIEDVGLLDENFFIYCEDVDWCLRARQRGWKMYYLPQAQIVHYGGQSSKKVSDWATTIYYESVRYYYRKHFAPKTPRLLTRFWLLGLRIQEARAHLENRLRRGKRVRYGSR